MSAAIQAYFGLSQPPFSREVPAADLWREAGRQEHVDRLVETLQARRNALVTGEPGVGKNGLLWLLTDALSPVHNRVVYISHVTLGRRDFYRQLALALGIEPRGTPASLFEAIQRDIRQLSVEQRIHPVLVLDEAHLLPDSTLGHLHVLLNFDMDRKPLMSLVLVGLPEILARLKLGIHRSLLTRLHTHIALPPLTLEQATAYLRRRMELAGARQDLFLPDALAVLHEATGGALRSLDTLAEATLGLAARDQVRLVDRALVRRALRETPLA